MGTIIRIKALTHFRVEGSGLFISKVTVLNSYFPIKKGEPDRWHKAMWTAIEDMLLNHERIWIAGALGQVGSAFAQLLDTTELEVLLTDQADVDITNMDQVRKYVEMNRPDVIINCAGIGGVEYCQKNSDLAYKVNAIGARNLSVAARSVHGKMVQLSTDDIFDGKAAESYNEFAVPAPISVYGKSKLAGEEFVKTIAPRYLIIRSSWVYGKGENFVTRLLDEAQRTDTIEVSADQFGSPTSAKELARAIYRLFMEDAYGLYHVVCQGVCSRKEFAETILSFAGKSNSIVTVSESRNREEGRPAYAVLDNLMLRLEGMEQPKHWKEALKEYMTER